MVSCFEAGDFRLQHADAVAEMRALEEGCQPSSAQDG
jgi:hypothetical protein